MQSPAQFDVHGVSHVGLKRPSNADHFLIARMERMMEVTSSSIREERGKRFRVGVSGHLMVVADGVGMNSGSAEASGLAIATMVESVSKSMNFARTGMTLEQDLLAEFSNAIDSAHARLLQEQKSRPDLKGLATTLTMTYVLGLRAYIGHVGDSRCYLIHEGRMVRVTKDQTLAQKLLDEGILTHTSAEGSRFKHVLASAVGSEDEQDLEVLTYMLSLSPQDALLLCTDGLTKHVSDDDITHIICSTDSAKAAGEKLLETALANGGSDNVTIVVGRFLGGPPKDAAMEKTMEVALAEDETLVSR